ncbi:hypothetical protein V6N12_038736 [Hibiscus sabdariffa]|uniref:Uncharacterized protein n=1 Tax=Hibiscus sabdariffa TaxID=183260 RepID=A0ABR2CAP8_9ROSI
MSSVPTPPISSEETVRPQRELMMLGALLMIFGTAKEREGEYEVAGALVHQSNHWNLILGPFLGHMILVPIWVVCGLCGQNLIQERDGEKREELESFPIVALTR